MNPSTDTGASEILANLSIGTIVLIALGLTITRLFLLYTAGPARAKTQSEAMAWARGLAEILESLIIAGVLVFLIIRPFFVQAFFIPSESMEDTLQGHDEYNPITGVRHDSAVHDHIFVNKLVYRYSEPQFGDIIVFKAPASADADDQMRGLPQKENVLIKRLIGLPNDTIEVKDGAVYRNGKKLDEPYIKRTPDDPIGMANPQPPNAVYGVDKPLKLGPDELFVMGDNRNNSNDSRFWGVLKRARVMGKAFVIFWPLNRIRVLH